MTKQQTALEEHIKRNHYNEAMIYHIEEAVRIDRKDKQKQHSDKLKEIREWIENTAIGRTILVLDKSLLLKEFDKIVRD